MKANLLACPQRIWMSLCSATCVRRRGYSQIVAPAESPALPKPSPPQQSSKPVDQSPSAITCATGISPIDNDCVHQPKQSVGFLWTFKTVSVGLTWRPAPLGRGFGTFFVRVRNIGRWGTGRPWIHSSEGTRQGSQLEDCNSPSDHLQTHSELCQCRAGPAPGDRGLE
jgi:hypothetical protein